MTVLKVCSNYKQTSMLKFVATDQTIRYYLVAVEKASDCPFLNGPATIAFLDLVVRSDHLGN